MQYYRVKLGDEFNYVADYGGKLYAPYGDQSFDKINFIDRAEKTAAKLFTIDELISFINNSTWALKSYNGEIHIEEVLLCKQ